MLPPGQAWATSFMEQKVDILQSNPSSPKNTNFFRVPQMQKCIVPLERSPESGQKIAWFDIFR